jgi:molybdopterin/thiamine biosynthesis adenylyltransferase
VAEEAAAGSQILVKLFNFVYLLSRRVRGATDFIITVNPRHEKFYEKTLLFKPAGLEREYEKVGGAPALLLRLDLAVPEERVRLEHGPAETRPAKSRTLYPMFHAPTGEPEIVAGLAASLRPMTRREFGCFFKIETDLLAEATAKQRTHILSRYLDVSGDAQYLSSTQQREMTRDLRRPRSPAYSYAEATSRNLGLVTEREQEMLRNSTVAIAGVGAVGGHYLLTLTRMGVGGFIIADPDRFEPANLQRQAGAFASTLGRSKVEVMAEMARAINPEVRIRTFGEGLTEANAGEFLRGADLVLDGIDFFQIDARRLLFRAARRAGVYAVTSGPIGYGATLQVFDPAGMSFDEYFGIGPGMTRAQRIAAFAVGLMPGLPTGGRMDPSRVDFENEKGPALASSIMLCAGVMCTEALRILLGHGEPQCVPHASYFDPYARRHIRQCASNGRNGWRDRLIRRLALLSFPSLRRLHRTERMTAGRASERQGDSTMVRKIRRALKMAKKLMSPAPWTTLFFGPGMIH